MYLTRFYSFLGVLNMLALILIKYFDFQLFLWGLEPFISRSVAALTTSRKTLSLDLAHLGRRRVGPEVKNDERERDGSLSVWRLLAKLPDLWSFYVNISHPNRMGKSCDRTQNGHLSISLTLVVIVADKLHIWAISWCKTLTFVNRSIGGTSYLNSRILHPK